MSLLGRVAIVVLRLQGKRDLADRAALMAAIARRRETDRHAPTRRYRTRHAVRVDDVHGHPCYTLRSRAAAAPAATDLRLLYLHGGCYTYEITPYHWAFLGALCDRLAARGLTITIPIYPLAPEHDHREAFAMLDPLAVELATRGDLALAGDSAGGGLALAVAQRLVARGHRPRALALLSPWVDAALDDPAIAPLDRADPMLAPGGLRAAGELWANGAPISDPAISPIHGEMIGLPPVTLFVGGKEILLPEARRLRDRLIAAHVDVDYVEDAGMFHVWPLVTRLPEAKRALARLVGRLQ